MTQATLHPTRRIALFVATAFSLAATGSALAQGPKPLEFEVVSIRPSHSQSGPSIAMPDVGPTPNGYRAHNLPVLFTILYSNVPTGGSPAAYFTNDKILGAPEWVRTERYDIDARIADTDLEAWHDPIKQPAMLKEMLVSLLADRFKLTVHRENKVSEVFDLVVAKNGPKLTPTKPDSTPPPGMTLPGGAVLVPGRGGMVFNFYNATMVSLAQALSNFAGRPVQDKTGLTGKYDFVLDRTPATPDQQPTSPTDFVSMLFTALQEQLGLKLVANKSSVEMVVLDSIERPSEN